MKNNDDKEIQEEIVDNLVKKTTALEKQLALLGNVDIPDHTDALRSILDSLNKIKAKDQTAQYLDLLNAIYAKLDSHPKATQKQIRLLLFPETNQGQYYKIVFGRLIPWGLAFMLATYIFITGYKAIEIYRYNQDISQSIHYQRAWLYLQQHSKKRMLGAMEEAYDKTTDK